MNEFLLTGTDIGNPKVSGYTKQLANGYHIVAGGNDIWGTTDQLHFAYLPYQGDFDLKFRLESLEQADLYTKAGLMARESLEADSAHVYFVVFPDNSPRNKNNGGYEFQFRTLNSGDSEAIYPEDYTTEPPEFPVNYPNTWLRLQRSEDQFHAWYSTDGVDWKLYASKSLKFSETLHIGLAVTSHNENTAVTASFQDFSLI